MSKNPLLKKANNGSLAQRLTTKDGCTNEELVSSFEIGEGKIKLPDLITVIMENEEWRMAKLFYFKGFGVYPQYLC